MLQSNKLVTVGFLARQLLQVNHQEAAVLLSKKRLDQYLIGGGWVALPFFHFSMTSLNGGFNLLKLTRNYVTT